MAKEQQVTTSAFIFGIFYYALKVTHRAFFDLYIIEISTYSLIILTALLVFVNINHLRVLYNPILGTVTFASVYLGVLLAGTKGLHNSSPEVIEGLTRIVLSVFIIWKLSADMRNLTLEINPFKKERSRIKGLFHGILYPPKDLLRLIEIITFVTLAFYFILTGINFLKLQDVDLVFLQKTERLSLNVLFFGIQTPMMMASRSSVSKTFSEYLKNLEWVQDSLSGSSLRKSYRKILSSNEITYDAISSNGKHLWLSILLALILQAFEPQLLALDILKIDYGQLVSSAIQSLINFFNQFF